MKRLHDPQVPHVFLKPGELFFSRKPAIISTVLGSCVSVTIFHPVTRLGAMCHVMLPRGPRDEGFRFADSTVTYMAEKIAGLGVRLDQCEVKMFGGADVLLPRELEGIRQSIGCQNVQEVRSRLQFYGVSTTSEDVGGKHGRKLFFDSHTGDVYMKKVQKKLI